MVKCLYCKIYFCLTKSGKVDFSSKRYQRQLNVNVSSQSRGVSVSVQNINRNDSLCQQRESMIYWRSYNRALHFTQVLFSRSAELLFCEKQGSSLFGFFLHWFSSVYFKQNGYSANKNRPSSFGFFLHWLHLPRLAEPFLWKWHCPSSCGVFLHWFTLLMFQQKCYPTKTQPLYNRIFSVWWKFWKVIQKKQ